MIDNRGNARICCDDWLTLPIGNLLEDDIESVWNSRAAQAIRESIHDGSFRYCRKDVCPALVAGQLPKADEITDEATREIISERKTTMATKPKYLNLAYDPTCNLKCPTCRHELIVLRGSPLARAFSLRDVVQRDLLDSAERITVTGYGDAVASQVHRSFLEKLNLAEHPKLGVNLMTNGLLFDAKTWAKWAGLHGGDVAISVSVDAASEHTYQLNRGGDFNKLVRNLHFMGGLRTTGQLKWFDLSYVVQANNFREMKQFVALGEGVGCDSILFQQFVLWEGTFSQDEFRRRAVNLPDHPDHQEFRMILADPCFHRDLVDLGNLSELA